MKAKIKTNLKGKRALIFAVLFVTFLIIFGTSYLLWLIYHKDKPNFVPKDTRGEVREGIKENIAEPLKDVWPEAGNALADAAYVPPKTETKKPSNNLQDTANWKTYKDAKTGVNFKYPENWSFFEGSKEGVFSFSPNEDSFDDITVYVYEKSINQSVDSWWSEKQKEFLDDFEFQGINNYGQNQVYLYKEKTGMEQQYYVVDLKNYILMILPSGEGSLYVKKFLQVININ